VITEDRCSTEEKASNMALILPLSTEYPRKVRLAVRE